MWSHQKLWFNLKETLPFKVFCLGRINPGSYFIYTRASQIVRCDSFGEVQTQFKGDMNIYFLKIESLLKIVLLWICEEKKWWIENSSKLTIIVKYQELVSRPAIWTSPDKDRTRDYPQVFQEVAPHEKTTRQWFVGFWVLWDETILLKLQSVPLKVHYV